MQALSTALRRAAASAAPLLALAALTAGPASASTGGPGSISQLPSPSDCIEQTGGADCATATGHGLAGASAVVTSPDGKNVYVASYFGQSVAEFARAADGSLTELGCVQNTGGKDCTTTTPGLDGPNAIAISPDGKNVYVGGAGSSRDEVAEFTRAADGTLSAISSHACIQEHGETVVCPDSIAVGLSLPYGVVVSPDGSNVYVTGGDSTLAEFTRGSDGSLTQLSGADACIQQHGKGTECGTNDNAKGLFVADAIAISPDGKNLYTGEDNSPGAIAEFSRGPGGALTQLAGDNACIGESGNSDCGSNDAGHGITNLYQLAITSDGANIYGASDEGWVPELARAADGSLTQLPSPNDCIQEHGTSGECGNTSGHGLGEPFGVAASPDGDNVYVSATPSKAGGGAMLAFARGGDGSLNELASPDDCVQEHGASDCGDTDGHGLDDVLGVAVSPDGANVYGATSSGIDDGAVTAFRRVAGGARASGGAPGSSASTTAGPVPLRTVAPAPVPRRHRARIGLVISHRHTGVSRRGIALVKVICHGTAGTRCKGVLTLGRYGHRRFDVRAGHRASLHVRLAKSLATRLRQRRRVSVRATVHLTRTTAESARTRARRLLLYEVGRP